MDRRDWRMPGFFISFEGIDGSGKSLQAAMLRDALTERFGDIVFCREPGGSQISEKIREILLSRENEGMTPVTEALLCAAARAQLVRQTIRPALAAGKVVICDRYVDSSLAYQGYGRALGAELVSGINGCAVEGTWPDITVYVEVDAEEGERRRAKGRDIGPDRFESEGIAFQKKVAEGYTKLAERYPERYFRVDGSLSPEEIHSLIHEEVSKRLYKGVTL